MTDRELLELAAKANGGFGGCPYIEDDIHEDVGFLPAGIFVEDGFNTFTWNPLNDDGDALRLAVKLRIDIGFHGKDGMYAQSQAHLGECQGSGGEFDCGIDDYALTRRSIVEAAAEIGSMKP